MIDGKRLVLEVAGAFRRLPNVPLNSTTDREEMISAKAT